MKQPVPRGNSVPLAVRAVLKSSVQSIIPEAFIRVVCKNFSGRVLRSFCKKFSKRVITPPFPAVESLSFRILRTAPSERSE